jgi:signal peptidase II
MFSYKENKLTNLSFGLLFGGVVSNLLDRIIFGYVRDFISIGSFPVFNIADASIVVGVILIIIISLKGDVKNEDKCRGRK